MNCSLLLKNNRFNNMLQICLNLNESFTCNIVINLLTILNNRKWYRSIMFKTTIPQTQHNYIANRHGRRGGAKQFCVLHIHSTYLLYTILQFIYLHVRYARIMSYCLLTIHRSVSVWVIRPCVERICVLICNLYTLFSLLKRYYYFTYNDITL